MKNSIVYNEDCIEGMKRYEDKYFELAIVDPPYGLSQRTTEGGTAKNSLTKFKGSMASKKWDEQKPEQTYFKELERISRNQIIWGGNYFGLRCNRTFIVWDKMTYIPTMSQIEYAWTSFDSPARIVKINSNQTNRIHPTQKPIRLYRWLLTNYAKEGDKILDTHLGSGSSRIAAYDMDFDFTGFELDKEYYDAQEKRFQDFKAQGKLF